MLHLRLISPPHRTDAVCSLLADTIGVTNVIVLAGAAREPAGDVVMCDVAREATDHLVDELIALGIEQDGSIAIEQIDTALSRVARQAQLDAPGEGVDAVVWQQVEERTSEESTLSATFLVFLSIATLIAGIGVLLDQPILIVGAMVVGPEFGPIAGLCVALVLRERTLAMRSLRALVIGFPTAIGVTVLATLLARVAGLVEPAMLDSEHPLTSFISRPDAFSFVVAFLAGIAGILSLTAAKSGALIGVLISVTTVPAAGSTAVALALGEPGMALGSALQLAVNLCGMVIAGTLTLLFERQLRQRTAPA
ncbi:MAG TPA: DUF389 domain-containing protein [Jiangellaceae bacterium]|nr:DUF389 domain-containing protein [Jiangellaceae bacterium]